MKKKWVMSLNVVGTRELRYSLADTGTANDALNRTFSIADNDIDVPSPGQYAFSYVRVICGS